MTDSGADTSLMSWHNFLSLGVKLSSLRRSGDSLKATSGLLFEADGCITFSDTVYPAFGSSKVMFMALPEYGGILISRTVC